MWQWPRTFFRTFLPSVEKLGHLTADERAYVRECMFPGDAELARRLCHGNNASGLP